MVVQQLSDGYEFGFDEEYLKYLTNKKCNEWIMQRSSAAYRQEWARVRKYDDRIRAWCGER